MSLMMSRYRSVTAMSRIVSDHVEQAMLEVEHASDLTPEELRILWERVSPERSLVVLTSLLKVDLRRRFQRGERPQAATYFDQFDALKASSDRVVSLVYEEFCLLREQGEPADPAEFCDRYEPWRDSLLAQLECHELLSQAAGTRPSMHRLPAPGDRFRSFRLGELLGEGGSARVFLARDESLGDRVVALKVSTDRGTEASIQGRLDHAHIVPVLSVIDDTDSGLRALCMPYRAGLTLDQVIAKVHSAPGSARASVFREVIAACQDPDEDGSRESTGWLGFPAKGTYAEGVAWIGSVVADALNYAHQRNVLHRDVKPANVLLTVRDGPQLLDFNLAHAPHSADRAQSALRGGTLPYMAPEQLEAFLDAQKWDLVNEAAEVYSLGLLLRELLTGRRPQAPDPKLPLPRAIGELLDLRRSEDFASHESDPPIPHALEAILARCLAPAPRDRYATAGALARDLRKFVAQRRRVRNRVVSVMVAAVFVTTIAVASTLLLRYQQARNAKDLVDQAFKQILEDKDFQGARKSLDLALLGDPNSFRAYWASSVLNGNSKNPGKALVDIEQAIRLAEGTGATKADLAALYVQKSVILLNQNKPDAAIKAAQQATALDPRNAAAYNSLATAWQLKGELETALDFMNQAIQRAENRRTIRNIDLAGYYYRRADLRLNIGKKIQKPKGLEDFRRAGPYYEQADEDIKTSRGRVARWEDAGGVRGPDADRDQYLSLCLAADVQIGLGDVASARDDYLTSVACYEEAEKLLHQASQSPADDGTAALLQPGLKLRLATDGPKLRANPAE